MTGPRESNNAITDLRSEAGNKPMKDWENGDLHYCSSNQPEVWTFAEYGPETSCVTSHTKSVQRYQLHSLAPMKATKVVKPTRTASGTQSTQTRGDAPADGCKRKGSELTADKCE